MFRNIYIENNLKDDPITLGILRKTSFDKITYIDDYSNVWGKVKKPYLQKRTTLDLFIAKKKPPFIKLTPEAYGYGDEKHYYYIHAYNCIYECEYCYLQGYFNTPDLVLFVNHDEILERMQEIINTDPDCWFHAGEFSDSLALSSITGEIELYHQFFKKNPQTKCELRTKSVNISKLCKLEPLQNFITTFSLSPENVVKNIDRKTPSLKSRLKAIEKLHKAGHPIGIHFDPMIYTETFLEDYQSLINQLSKVIGLDQVRYFSLGVVRFTSDVYKEVTNNYPNSLILKESMTKSHDSKIKYNRPMRRWMMDQVKKMALESRAKKESIYLCMEGE